MIDGLHESTYYYHNKDVIHEVLCNCLTHHLPWQYNCPVKPLRSAQVDYEVWSRAQSFFKFKTLTPIKAKGYVDPVPVFRPLEQALRDDTEVGVLGMVRDGCIWVFMLMCCVVCASACSYVCLFVCGCVLLPFDVLLLPSFFFGLLSLVVVLRCLVLSFVVLAAATAPLLNRAHQSGVE